MLTYLKAIFQLFMDLIIAILTMVMLASVFLFMFLKFLFELPREGTLKQKWHRALTSQNKENEPE